MAVAQLAQQPQFAGVGLARMRRWAEADGWEFARQQQRDAWKRRAQAKLSQGMLRRFDRQMQMLAHLHDEAARLRCQQAVQPRSWESVANVQLKAAQMMRDWSREHTEAVAQLAAPQGQPLANQTGVEGAGLADDAIGKMTDEEAQTGAHAILHDRLKKRLRPPGETAQDDGQVDAPPSQPVQLKTALGG